jgi:hypothetical protein
MRKVKLILPDAIYQKIRQKLEYPPFYNCVEVEKDINHLVYTMLLE